MSFRIYLVFKFIISFYRIYRFNCNLITIQIS
nr:MAG TPA: hypothetical protein [Caudoviricetes sp.]